jgi:hypothetical protein
LEDTLEDTTGGHLRGHRTPAELNTT